MDNPTIDSASLDRFFETGLCTKKFLEDLSPETVQAFDSIKQANTYLMGSIVFAQGQPSTGVFLLIEGTAKVILKSDNVSDEIIRIAMPGEMLEVTATIANEPHETSLEAIDRCQIDFIERHDFLSLLHNHPAACYRLVQLLGRGLNLPWD